MLPGSLRLQVSFWAFLLSKCTWRCTTSTVLRSFSGGIFLLAIWFPGVRLSGDSIELLSLLGMVLLCQVCSFSQLELSTHAEPPLSQQADLVASFSKWAHIISKKSLKPLLLDPCMVFFPIPIVRLMLFRVTCSGSDIMSLHTSQQNGVWTEASFSSLKLSFTTTESVHYTVMMQANIQL